MATKYLVIVHPIEGQNQTTYSRNHRTAVLPKVTTTIQGMARDRNGVAITPPLKVRLLMDEAPVSDWIVPSIGGWGVDVPLEASPLIVDGLPVSNHVMRWEAESPTVPDTPDTSWFGNCFLFQIDPPLGEAVEQWVWIGPTKFDDHYNSITSCIPYRWRYVPGFTPVARAPYPAETAVSWGAAALPHASQEVQNLTGTVSHHALQYEPCAMAPAVVGGTPPISISAFQTYSYFHQNKLYVRLRDGARGLSMGGHVWKFVPSPTPGATYFLAVQGRIGWVGPDGQMLTVAGWRQKLNQLAPYPSDLEVGTTAQKDYYMSRMEFYGALDPGCLPWDRPWGFDSLDRYEGGTGYHQFALCNTYGRQIHHVDHLPAHTPGGVPAIHLLAQMPADSLPWDCVYLPSGQLWVTDVGRHSVWRLDVVKLATGSYSVTQTREYRSLFLPTFADIGITQLWFEPSKQSVQSIRDRFYRAGVLGENGVGSVGSCPWPQGIDKTSDNHIIIGCRYGFNIYEIDPDEVSAGMVNCSLVSTIWEGTAQGTGDYGYKDVNISVNNDGTTGPLDLVRAVGWGMNCDRGYYRAGGSPAGNLGRIFPENSYRQAMEGQQTTVTTWEYPGAAASRGGYLFLSGLGTFQHVWRVRKRAGSDPVLNQTLFQTGSNLWKKGDEFANTSPSFALTHGEHGAGRFGLLPTIDQLNALDDVALGEALWSGLGTGIQRQFSEASLWALIYYVRVTAKPLA